MATQLTNNFTLEEFTRSATAKKRGIDNTPTSLVRQRLQELANALQSIRDFTAKSISLSSGYRCPALNKAVGGASNSQHMTGYAADIHPTSGDMAAFKRAILLWAESHDFDQIIFEQEDKNGIPAWIHFGVRHTQHGQRRQKLVARKVGGKWQYTTYKG